MQESPIPFHKPYITGKELAYINQAIAHGKLSGDGPFTRSCQAWLEKNTEQSKALLTHSCTAALEMAVLLLNIQPGDEIILPSFTFVSTPNAFVLRGGVPVFVDIREDTLNLDETLIEDAITPKTKVIVPVHYAGVSCEMDTIMSLARSHGLKVIEDAAQGVMATYKGKPLGSLGDFGAYSFHETKNIIAGEGGALLVNNPDFTLRANVLREKGTDRSRLFRGEADKYTWEDIGSSYLPGELIAAFLLAQLEEAQEITRQRRLIWDRYHALFESLDSKGVLRRPIIPKDCDHNAHIYYVLLPTKEHQEKVLNAFKENNISSAFHYVPLHSSPAGRHYGRAHGSLAMTDYQSSRLVRLPLWIGLTEQQQQQIVDIISKEI